MVFTVLGAVAELERSLIIERVKAGLRNARAKAHRPATCSRGRSQDWRAPRFWFLMGGNHPSNGLDQRDSPESLLCAESLFWRSTIAATTNGRENPFNYLQGKPHGVPGATGVRLPKSPSVSPFGPAVK